MRHTLWIITFLLLTIPSMAQYTIKGTVSDKDTHQPLVGATITLVGSTGGTISDVNGAFVLEYDGQSPTLEIKYVGYRTSLLKFSQGGNISGIMVDMQVDTQMLDDVVVTSTIAVSRKTPVAVSNLLASHIEEKMGAQELVEILKTTPGVHANRQGGGFGDSEIYMRGFDSSNTATMINGVPVNDMEHGSVYQSNWSGLRDVINIMQTQRGVGASKVSSPSIGGTINIITKGAEAKKGGFASYTMGSYGFNKLSFSVSTGLSKTGWAMTLLGSKEWGNNAPQGLDFEGYTWFMSLVKKFNANHQLTLTAFGSPQTHQQRSANGALTIADWEKTERMYGVKDYRYNSVYGFDKHGRRRSSSYNMYHKPQISLSHQWNINDHSSLNTVAYISIGRGGGYSGQANENYGYSFSNWRGSNYGSLVTGTFADGVTPVLNPDGTFNYAGIQDINAASENGSMLIMSESKNNHNWYGFISNYNTKLGKYIDFYGGIDFRYYKGTHTNEIIDLYDGAYFMDSSRGKVSAANNKNASNDAWRNEKLGVGDVVYRDYDGHVMQEGVFFQGEYNRENISAFLSGSLSNSTYWRYDRFYYDEQHAKSEKLNHIGFNLKAGANYNINENHNVFANVGYISRAPKFSHAFMQENVSNVVNKHTKNEKALLVDLGYGFRNERLQMNVVAYYINWMDKSMIKYGMMENKAEYYMNMTGVDAIHKGLEIDLKYKPFRWMELSGMLSLGDWKWSNNATGYAYNAQGRALTTAGKETTPGSADHAWASIKLDGVKVGGSAQTTASLGANFQISKDLRVGADWVYYGNNYAYYSFNGNNLSLGKEVSVLAPWEMPSTSTFDVNASYRFKLGGLDAILIGNVTNLFNNQYISKAWNPSAISSSRVQEATADNIYCFYDMGRHMTLRLKVNF